MDSIFNHLDNNHIDLMKEIGNIGAGNAATALSQLIHKKVLMDVPEVNIPDFSQLPEILGGAEAPVIGILSYITGELGGMLIFVVDKMDGRRLVNLLMGKEEGDQGDLDEMDLSAMKEIGSIITGAYLSSLSMLTQLKITASAPFMAVDMAGAILSVPAVEFGNVSDKVLLIKTHFKGVNGGINGYLILTPDERSYQTIIKSVGME